MKERGTWFGGRAGNVADKICLLARGTEMINLQQRIRSLRTFTICWNDSDEFPMNGRQRKRNTPFQAFASAKLPAIYGILWKKVVFNILLITFSQWECQFRFIFSLCNASFINIQPVGVIGGSVDREVTVNIKYRQFVIENVKQNSYPCHLVLGKIQLSILC